jgi:hypothetical protein
MDDSRRTMSGNASSGSSTPDPQLPTPDIACPFCGSTDSELLSPFGSQLLTDQRRCLRCKSYFEALRDDR